MRARSKVDEVESLGAWQLHGTAYQPWSRHLTLEKIKPLLTRGFCHMQTHLILMVTYRLEPTLITMKGGSGPLPFPSTLSPEGKDLAGLLMPSAYSVSVGGHRGQSMNTRWMRNSEWQEKWQLVFCVLHSIIRSMWRGRGGLFLTLGNLAIVLTLMNSLTLPLGTMGIIWITVLKSLLLQGVVASVTDQKWWKKLRNSNEGVHADG